MPTQTRISEDTHVVLVKLAEETGRTHQELIDTALRRYARELFLEEMNRGFAALRANPKAWSDELAERAGWEPTLTDGGT